MLQEDSEFRSFYAPDYDFKKQVIARTLYNITSLQDCNYCETGKPYTFEERVKAFLELPFDVAPYYAQDFYFAFTCPLRKENRLEQLYRGYDWFDDFKK